MSHITTIRTQMTDAQALAKALGDVGYGHARVQEKAPGEAHAGDVVSAGGLLKSVTFRRDASGFFATTVGDMGRMRITADFIARLTQRYAYHAARARLEQQGFELAGEETDKAGRIHLVLRRVG